MMLQDKKNQKCRLCKQSLSGADFVLFYGYRCHMRCVDKFKKEEERWDKIEKYIRKGK